MMYHFSSVTAKAFKCCAQQVYSLKIKSFLFLLLFEKIDRTLFAEI